MSDKENKYTGRRLRSSYFTTIISISLVLFMLGILGLIILNAQQISNHVKENIGFSIILKDGIKEVEIAQIQKSLDAENFVKSTHFIHPDSAAAELQRELGEDFISFLGYNPLLPSIDVKLNADYANTDSLSVIEANLTENPKIKEVFYQKDLVSLINENVKKISFYLLAFSALLLTIAMALINNTIRLSIYSKRFLIKTMQLVGAKSSFIQKPFVLKGIGNGLVAAFLSIGLIVLFLYYLQQQMPEIIDFKNIELYGALFLIVIILGILISWISTMLAVRKYLRMEAGNLY
ncbi:MAG: permease-like cell division protein FtsX [Flavobacteriales bacterium]|nr:MAG: FtsX-like permease family protein [Flavobacteriales bacterium]MBE7442954.1 cell division protein FtsX [Flavobacteriales bacterium]MBV6485094.1 Cell division protein FtsX [Flavobacteriales bacterium]MBX2960048.1 permease-like cell division protein FtsX [Flavobacteriales bacterium]